MRNIITADRAIRKTSAIARMRTAYYQISAIILEYEAVLEKADSSCYLIRDFETAKYKPEYERRAASDARISAAYTNSAPELREGRDSVPGHYVILELEEIAGSVCEDGINKPLTTAAMCSVTYMGEPSGCDRADYSEMKIYQLLPMESADGETVILPGTAPELKKENLSEPDLDSFSSAYLEAESGRKIYCGWHLPARYSFTDRLYPLVVSIAGAGRVMRSDECQKHNPLGGNYRSDGSSVFWTLQEEEYITFSPQISLEDYDNDIRNFIREPEPFMDDVMSVIRRFLEAHRIDPQRIFLIGNSFGTVCCSIMLQKPANAALFAAYMQCNGNFSGAVTMFRQEYNQLNAMSKTGFCSLEQYLDRKTWVYENFFETELFEKFSEVLQSVVDNRVAFDIWHGYDDEQGPPSRAITVYLCLREMYRRENLSEESINRLVRIHLIRNEEMLAKGLCSFHAATRYALSQQELYDFVKSCTKPELLALT